MDGSKDITGHASMQLEILDVNITFKYEIIT